MELQAPERELLERLRASNIHIPPRPQVLQDIESMLQDDDSTERMIAQLIARDVALSAEVFKLVNSPVYRRSAKIDSLEQAVRMLGRKPMGQVTRTALLRQQLGGGAARFERFWERSTDVATLASTLCDQLDRPGRMTAEQAYLVGLFHDCGVPVLMQHLKDYADRQLAAATAAPDFIAEDDEHATSHCIAGLLVAQEWQLPDMLCEAIRGHHYVIADDQPAPHAIALLQLALTAYARHNGWDNPEWEYQQARALATLDMEEGQLDGVIAAAVESFDMLH